MTSKIWWFWAVASFCFSDSLLSAQEVQLVKESMLVSTGSYKAVRPDSFFCIVKSVQFRYTLTPEKYKVVPNQFSLEFFSQGKQIRPRAVNIRTKYSAKPAHDEISKSKGKRGKHDPSNREIELNLGFRYRSPSRDADYVQPCPTSPLTVFVYFHSSSGSKHLIGSEETVLP